MITETVLDTIIGAFAAFIAWSRATIAVNAYGFHLSFFEIWTSNTFAFVLTDLFLHIFNVFEGPDDSGQEE